MDAIKQLFEKKVAILVAGIVIGLILGVFYAWVIQPVKWIDGEPSQLRQDLRVDYLRMVIDSYATNLDAEKATRRFEALGEFKDETLDLVGQNPEGVDPGAIQKFQALVAIETPLIEGTAMPEEIGAPSEGQTPEAAIGEAETPAAALPAIASTTETAAASAGERNGILSSRYIFPVCGATLLLGVLLAIALFLRRRMEAVEEEPEFAGEAPETFETQGEDYLKDLGIPEQQELATFRTTYSLGDDLYDDSFSIESPGSGDFLGECGVGIADVMGAGDPKKVSAFEIWLFDKNDIQTVTKIMLSTYAFGDEETRARLSAKGDLVMAESGAVVVLETASLQVEARVVDFAYGESALPAESYFERMTIELKAVSK